jgi:hypothetical protein
MLGIRHNGKVIRKVGTALLPGAGYRVYVVPAGGVASGAPSGTTINLYRGHGFKTGDKIAVYSIANNTFTYSGVNTVSSRTSTTIVMSGGTYTVAAGDIIVNLGPDTGVSAPALDGSPFDTHQTPDLSDSATRYVTTGDDGEYGWYGVGARAWELVVSGTTLIEIRRAPFQTQTGDHRRVTDWATGGKGTSADPWTGWEEAFYDIPTEGALFDFEPGFYLRQSAITMPVNQTGWTVVRGNGATIRFSDLTTGPLIGIPSHADYDVWRYLLVENVIIDANNIAGSGGVVRPLLLGMTISTRQRINSEWIIARNVRMVNVSDTDRVAGISLGAQHVSNGEATQTYTRDCLFENIRQEGGAAGIGITAGTDAAGNGANHVIERVTIRKHYHKSNTQPTAFVIWANIQLGQDGIVRDCLVEDCYWQNSADVAIEVDNGENVIVRNCVAVDTFVAAFYATNIGSTGSREKTRVIFENCRAVVNASIASTAEVQCVGFKVWGDTAGGGAIVGNVVFDKCHYENYTAVPHHGFQASGKFDNVEFLDCSYYAPNLTSVSLVGVRNIFYILQYQPGRVWIRDFRAKWSYDVNGAVGTMCMVRHIRCEGGRIDVDGFLVDGAFTNNGGGNGSFFCYSSPEDAAATNVVSATLRRFIVQSLSGAYTNPANNTMIYVVDDTDVTSRIVVEDCDFSVFAAGTSRYVFFQDAADRPVLVYRRNREDGTSVVIGKDVASANTITVPTGAERVTITGTTTVKTINATWNGHVIRLHFAAACVVDETGNIKLGGAFTSTAGSSLTLEYDGTSWVELGRSVN